MPMPGPSVTSRILAILNAFVPGEARLTLTQISRRTGLPIATTHRLVGELTRGGGLEREPGGTYRIGVRLFEIGSLAPIGGGLRELAMPFMEDLYEATHENVQLAVREGLEALFLEKISGRSSVKIVTRVGGRLPLHATGVGKVLLAYAPPGVIDAVIDRGLPPLTDQTITDPDRLRSALAEVRANGFAWTRDEMTVGAMSIGAPVFGPDAHVVAALSVVVATGSGDVGRLAPSVKTAARGLSRQVTDWWDRMVPSAPDAAVPLGAAMGKDQPSTQRKRSLGTDGGA
jgi:DNA-binding IclR family transcriptional regulator